MIYAENLKVYCNHGISGILDMELTAREGEHGRLTLRGRLADGGSMSAGGESVRVTAEESGSGKEETLFQGTVLESHVFVEDGVSQIILSAGGIDEGMDRRRRSRSFQDTSQTYAQIIRDILSEYDGELQCEMPSVKIGRPMVQYEETDWEFCRRMAGSMGAGLFSHGENPCPCLSVGLVEGRKIDFPSGDYRCGVDECYYQRGKGQGIPRADFLYYEVSTDRHYRIGDYTWYGGRKLHIYEARAVLEREELIFTYKLGSARRFCGTSRPNRKLSGLSVPGCVEKTEGESVYMKLDMDGEDGKALHPFMWAPATGNTAYCMPKAGTRAYLYFPDCYGQEPFAVGSIRTNGYSFCFGNIQDRGLETEHGKKLRLQADALRLEGGRPDGLQQAVLGEDMLCLQAGEGGLTLRAGNGISVQAPWVRVRTPLAINQNRLGEKGTGRKNPATGGGSYVTSQYEFSITSPLGELVGLEYEEYNPFEDEIAYESYEAVEKRRLGGLFKGIATALAIGAVVALVAFTGGAVLGAVVAGAVVAGVGSAAAVATYMHDKENSTASSAGTYIRNSGTASLITAMVIGSFWAAPYAAKALALQETGGLPFTMLFGKLVALETVESWMLVGTEGFAALNAFFQTNELLAFFGETKELGDETGCAAYDETKMLVEGYSVQFLLMGFEQWLKEKALQTPRDVRERKTSKTEGKKEGKGADISVKPSHKPDKSAKPEGRRTVINYADPDPDNIRALTRENEAADALAQQGYVVEQNPSVSGSKNPDYLIEGEIFDCYSPKGGTRVRNIASGMQRKVDAGQTKRIILNLYDWLCSGGNIDDLIKQLNDWPIEGLEEVKIINQYQEVIDIYP